MTSSPKCKLSGWVHSLCLILDCPKPKKAFSACLASSFVHFQTSWVTLSTLLGMISRGTIPAEMPESWGCSQKLIKLRDYVLFTSNMKIFPMQAGVLGNSVPRKLSYSQKARKAFLFSLAFLSYGTEVSASNLNVDRGGSVSCGSSSACPGTFSVVLHSICRSRAGFPHAPGWIWTAHLHSSWCCKSRWEKKYNFQANKKSCSLWNLNNWMSKPYTYRYLFTPTGFWRHSRKEIGRSGLTDILIINFWHT